MNTYDSSPLSRYSRQTVYEKIGRAGQGRILAARAVVLGCGALGTVIAGNLCRAGLGHIRLVDRDCVEISNLQRQTLFDEEDARRGLPKAIAAREKLTKINSDVSVEAVVEDINSTNIERLCAGADIVLDGADNMELRYLINECCVKSGTPWIYGGALRAGGASLTVLPGETACFRCAFPQAPPAASLATCASAGVLNMITGLIACVQSAEALKILTDSPALRGGLLIVDLWENSTDCLPVERDPLCPVCGERRFELLSRPPASRATSLCGQDAVQVIPAAAQSVDFAAIAEKLGRAGKVEYSRFMLNFTDERASFSLFPDGRAIIRRVPGENAAMSVYAEYIGL